MREGGPKLGIVPLFPLNAVLFPGMELPLHIFEPRYKLMVERCLAAEGRFAVGLIRTGSEVGEAPAEAFSTGTIAQITDIARYSDGRMNILATGTERCEVRDVIDDEPYRQARVRPMPESRDPVPPEVMARASELYAAYVEILLSLSNLPLPATLPAEPEVASYLIARTLQTDLFTKQALLEAPGPRARLTEEVRLLERDVERLRSFAELHSQRGYFFYRGNRISLN